MSGNDQGQPAADPVGLEQYRAHYQQRLDSAGGQPVPGGWVIVNQHAEILAALDTEPECLGRYHAMVLADPTAAKLGIETANRTEPEYVSQLSLSPTQRAMDMTQLLSSVPEFEPLKIAKQFLLRAQPAGDLQIGGERLYACRLDWPDQEGAWAPVGLLLATRDLSDVQLCIEVGAIEMPRHLLDQAVAVAVNATVPGANLTADGVAKRRQDWLPDRCTVVEDCIDLAVDLAERVASLGCAAPYTYARPETQPAHRHTPPGTGDPGLGRPEQRKLVTVTELQRTIAQRPPSRRRRVWAILDNDNETVIETFSRVEQAAKHLNQLIDQDPTAARYQLHFVDHETVSSEDFAGPTWGRAQALMQEIRRSQTSPRDASATATGVKIRHRHRRFWLRAEIGGSVNPQPEKPDLAARLWWYSRDGHGRREQVAVVTQTADQEQPTLFIDSRQLGVTDDLAVITEVLKNATLPEPPGSWSSYLDLAATGWDMSTVTGALAQLCFATLRELQAVQRG